MENFKLTIELLPKGAWENDFSKTLPKKDWDTLRNLCYDKAKNKCDICGYETDDLDAHEIWDFNINTKTQTLKDIVALCSKCHGVKHMRNSERLGFGENAKRHFMSVNNCSELDFASHYTQAQMDFEERNKVYRWKIKADLDKFGGKGIEIKEKYIPFIINPYTEEDLTKCENDCSLLPRIINIDINNYNGTITLVCDRTNKVEWICDNVIKTKFNFGRKFITTFSVEDLNFPNIYFKLIGDGGETESKLFMLKSIN